MTSPPGSGPALAALLAALAGCAGPPQVRTTFLRSVDLVEMTDWMAQELAADEVVAEGAPDDPPWIISIDRVANQTNQIIPDREKWLFVSRLRAMLAQSELSRENRIVWIVPPERWPLDDEIDPAAARLDPTHLLTATFSSLTTSSGGGRADTTVCSYQLVDLDSGAVVWEGLWEVKRAVQGVVYD